ncbi:MAG: tetratricopeptide repeat protein [Rhodopila sp.]
MRIRALAGFGLLALLAACAGSPSGLSSTQTPSVRVAQAAMASGDLMLAESIYAKASAAAPSDADVQVSYADALLRLNKVAQARSVLTAHMKTVRDPRPLGGPLGVVEVLQGDAQAALADLAAAAAADPGNIRWIVDKAIALDLLARHGEAQALYRQALAADADDMIATNNLAVSLALSGQKSEAASVAAPLAGRGDLPPRVALTGVVLRAANGEDISGARDTMSPGEYDHVLQLAKAMNSPAK